MARIFYIPSSAQRLLLLTRNSRRHGWDIRATRSLFEMRYGIDDFCVRATEILDIAEVQRAKMIEAKIPGEIALITVVPGDPIAIGAFVPLYPFRGKFPDRLNVATFTLVSEMPTSVGVVGDNGQPINL